MIFEVGGVNLLPYVEINGFKWSENDLDGSDSGRTLDGIMHRGRVAIKKKLEITCRPLLQSEAQILYNAISPEYVTVTYSDPKDGTLVKTMYNSTRNGAILVLYDDGTAKWDGISFSLIEV